MEQQYTIEQGIEEINLHYDALTKETKESPIIQWAYSTSLRYLETQRDILRIAKAVYILDKMVFISILLSLAAGVVASIAMFRS